MTINRNRNADAADPKRGDRRLRPKPIGIGTKPQQFEQYSSYDIAALAFTFGLFAGFLLCALFVVCDYYVGTLGKLDEERTVMAKVLVERVCWRHMRCAWALAPKRPFSLKREPSRTVKGGAYERLATRYLGTRYPLEAPRLETAGVAMIPS